ncbi:MAG: RsmB/NOP family class I SAM-dependent RNA methyltransferase, partial [Verrucomicrobiota bacterium]
EEQEQFLSALVHPSPIGTALAWLSPVQNSALAKAAEGSLPDWLPDSIELLEPGEKAGKTKAFSDGLCYPLDFSSVLTGSALLTFSAMNTETWKVLDLCAAPGGKSILATLFLRPALLLGNEVEGKRLGILRHNLSRCQIPNVFTQRLAPEIWREKASGAFDLTLVDAPCSGQSLLAKGTENPGCFHPSITKGNARRQLRILTDASATVRSGGFLFYSTCTFDLRENEGVIRKFLSRNETFSAVAIPHLEEYRSSHANFPVYRFYPHLISGAGGFVALLRHEGDPDESPTPIPEELLSYPVPSSTKSDSSSATP